MRQSRTVVIAVLVTLLSGLSSASDAQKFDGKWLTTVSCANYRDALGFSYQFVSMVKDGVFHGVHGTEGEPGSLVIDGTIPADGKASLYAKGRMDRRNTCRDGIRRKARNMAITSMRTSKKPREWEPGLRGDHARSSLRSNNHPRSRLFALSIGVIAPNLQGSANDCSENTTRIQLVNIHASARSIPCFS